MRTVVIGAIAIGSLAIGISAQRRPPPPPAPAQDGATVRPLSPEAGRSEPGKKSDTDYWFDSQIVRMTAHYDDATITTDRTNEGVVTSQVADKSGNLGAQLSVRSSVLQFSPVGGTPFLAANDSGERPTLDAASRQAYGLWKDGSAKMKWQAGLMRPRGAARDLEPRQLHTEWAQGLTAHATRKFNARVRVNIKGEDRIFSGEVVSTRLTRDGVEIGASVWFPAQQTFMWRVGSTSGSLSPETLSEANNGPGGWKFSVNPAWVNIQTIAFRYFSTTAKPLAEDRNCRPRTGGLARLAAFFAPTLHANSAGCDFPFVWLNGTGFEPCCNRHDVCFAAYGCTWKTWWMVWTNWRCDVCNMIVFSCFSHGGDTWNPGDA